MGKRLEAGAHSAPDKCGHLAGGAARWMLETLLEQEAVKLRPGPQYLMRSPKFALAGIHEVNLVYPKVKP